MSHLVSVQTQVRDATALAAACRRLSLAEPAQETVQLFSGEMKGLAVRLPDWQYPVVVDVDAGKLHYDNFEGHVGRAKPDSTGCFKLTPWKRLASKPAGRASPSRNNCWATAASNSRSRRLEMSTPRRRIIRPEVSAPNLHAQPARQIQKLRERLEKERTALNRWMNRLKRAFRKVERTQQSDHSP